MKSLLKKTLKSILIFMCFFPILSYGQYLSQYFENQLIEPQLLVGNLSDEILHSKAIQSNFQFDTFCSTGNFVENDSLVLTVIKGHSKNDTTYHIGLIFKNCELVSAIIVPTSFEKNKQERLIGWIYADFDHQYIHCLNFVIQKIKPVNIAKLDHKFDHKEAKILETKKYQYCNF